MNSVTACYGHFETTTHKPRPLATGSGRSSKLLQCSPVPLCPLTTAICRVVSAPSVQCSPLMRDVRIVLCGDEGTGKSSLITSLIKESFVEKVQKVLPEISLPPEVAPEGVLTKIIDTSAAPASRPHLEAELRRSHVICIIYSISQPSSFDRIRDYWLPHIRSLGINVPIILVGNKIDLRSGSVTPAALEAELAPLLEEYKEVETCVECSARIPLNVSEVFYFAQKAVVYPTAPLYDSREHALKPACVDALRRIFRLCDSDKDSLLNDAELNDFQRKCFDSPLQSQELEGIKDLVQSAPIPGSRFPYDHLSAYGGSTSSSVNGDLNPQAAHPHLRSGSLTLAGFLYLHTLFIQRGRLETTWTVLRTFGYGVDLSLEDSFVRPAYHVPPDCSVELSPHGMQFLTDVFEAHDKDRDGALSSKELENLFLTAPGGKHPWTESYNFPDCTITDEHGRVTLQGWLAAWSMLTLLEHRTTLAYLAYLGYPSFPLSSSISPPTPIALHSSAKDRNAGPSPPSTTSALKVTRTRKADRKKKGRIQRSVLLGLVLGAAGSGKTALLRAMLGKEFDPNYEPTSKVLSVVSTVEQAGAEKYLVLQELTSRTESDHLRNLTKLSSADVLIYVYDSSDTNSFSYITNLRQTYPSLSSLPSLFVATKADLDLAQQRHEVQPDVYCSKLGLAIPGLGAGPLSVSTRTGQLADLYGLVCVVALDPRGAVPGGGAKDRTLSASTRTKFLLYIGIVVLGGGLALAFVGVGVNGPGFRRGGGSGLGKDLRVAGGGAGTQWSSWNTRWTGEEGWMGWLLGGGQGNGIGLAKKI